MSLSVVVFTNTLSTSFGNYRFLVCFPCWTGGSWRTVTEPCSMLYPQQLVQCLVHIEPLIYNRGSWLSQISLSSSLLLFYFYFCPSLIFATTWILLCTVFAIICDLSNLLQNLAGVTLGDILWEDSVLSLSGAPSS